MTIRWAALLAAFGATFYALYSLSIEIYLLLTKGLTVQFAPVGVLSARIAMALFFVCVYAEASKLTSSIRRGTVALAATLLMLVQVVCLGFELQQLVALRHAMMVPGAHMTMAPGTESLAVGITKLLLFAVLGGIGWALLFLAFAEKPIAFLRRMTPSLAVFLAALQALTVFVAFVFPAGPSRPRLSLPAPLSIGVSLYTSISVIIFLVVLWRAWDSRSPVHEIVLGKA